MNQGPKSSLNTALRFLEILALSFTISLATFIVNFILRVLIALNEGSTIGAWSITPIPIHPLQHIGRDHDFRWASKEEKMDSRYS